MWLCLLLILCFIILIVWLYSKEKYTHPVLKYQYEASKYNHPANYGDPIRPGYYGIDVY